jgi:hypothetical protein
VSTIFASHRDFPIASNLLTRLVLSVGKPLDFIPQGLTNVDIMKSPLLFAVLATFCACAPVDDSSTDPTQNTDEEVRVCQTSPERAAQTALENASRGLLYTSESDYPFDYVSLTRAPTTRAKITGTQMVRALGLASTTRVEERTLDRMFSHLVNPDVTGPDAPRFAALKRTIQQRLTYVQVFAVGTIEVQIYIVGRDRCGSLVGLHTTSIET